MQLCGSMLYQFHGGVCAVCCAEWNSAQHALARLICKPPDDGRRPKHVGAVLI